MGRASHFRVRMNLGRSRLEEGMRVQDLGARFGNTPILEPIVAMGRMPLESRYLHIR